MVKEIIWTKRANDSFNNVIAYLERDWNTTVTKKFIVRTYHIIELLAENPELGTIENHSKGIRGFLITKHNLLFYRSTDKEIIILNLYDTRSSPKKSKY
jgi:plasmid stabilization system protein ParE